MRKPVLDMLNCAEQYKYKNVKAQMHNEHWTPEENKSLKDNIVLLMCHLKATSGTTGFTQTSSYSASNNYKYNNNSSTNNSSNSRIERRKSNCFRISSLRRELTPARALKWPRCNRVQVTCNTSSAYHVRATCRVSCGTKRQFSY